MDLELKGKRVLITGASKGIGLAVAHAFAKEGADVVLVARTAADLEVAREAVRSHGVNVDVLAMDVAKERSARELADRFADIDVLINNAGAIPRGALLAVDEDTWRRAWDLKVFGFINLSREYFRLMSERRAGVIVNVIGMAGERPRYDYIAGTTGNAGLMAFTRALGSHSVDHNVRVLAVNPGYTETERLQKSLGEQAFARFGDASRWRELLSKQPFGRAARADEVADVVVFVASARASYMSGCIVSVDGGAAHRS